LGIVKTLLLVEAVSIKLHSEFHVFYCGVKMISTPKVAFLYFGKQLPISFFFVS